MHASTKHILTKVSSLSIAILVVFHIGLYILSAENTQATKPTNDLIYPAASNNNISAVSVALGTGVGIRLNRDGISDVTFYPEQSEIGADAEESRSIRRDLLVENMLIIREYLSLARTDVLELLDESTDRRSTLNTLISQLELRFKNASISLINLENQKTLLIQDMEKTNTDIESIKGQMSNDFTTGDDDGLLSDVDIYLDLRSRNNRSFTDIVLINQFLAQYQFLNDYNKRLLDTLINNREAIISQSFVVVPDSGDEFLKQFKLLYEEEEFKAQR